MLLNLFWSSWLLHEHSSKKSSLSRKQFVLSKVKIEIKIKIENGKLTCLLGCVGLSWRWMYLKSWNKQICEYMQPWKTILPVWRTLKTFILHEKMVIIN
jgi:hypothetical protein